MSTPTHHTMVMSAHADALRAAGQHLRRGLLLYGPPGTGKTHTVMYLCNQLEGRTVLLLAGPALHAIGQAGSLARELAPSMIVIEDVDLSGMDRGLPGGEHTADRVIERIAGAAAAFVKELARRAVLARITHDLDYDTALERALGEMLEHAPPILRRSLGVAGAG